MTASLATQVAALLRKGSTPRTGPALRRTALCLAKEGTAGGQADVAETETAIMHLNNAQHSTWRQSLGVKLDRSGLGAWHEHEGDSTFFVKMPSFRLLSSSASTPSSGIWAALAENRDMFQDNQKSGLV